MLIDCRKYVNFSIWSHGSIAKFANCLRKKKKIIKISSCLWGKNISSLVMKNKFRSLFINHMKKKFLSFASKLGEKPRNSPTVYGRKNNDICQSTSEKI